MTRLALSFRGPLPQIIDDDGQPPKPPAPQPGSVWPRAILHADLDAFFATAESLYVKHFNQAPAA